MSNDLSRRAERKGTRNLFVAGAIVAAILLIGVGLWPLIPGDETGAAHRSSGTGTETPQSAAGEKSNQEAGGSNTGATAPQRQEDSTGGKARAIQQSATAKAVSDTQRDGLRSYFSDHDALRTDNVNFSIAIGSAVPRDQELRPTPAEVSNIMQGYHDSDYIVVRDQLVIVDRPSRRVVAIVPGINGERAG